MEFHDYASHETAALITRLLGHQSGACLQQLHALREAIDAAARALETPTHAQQDIHELIGRLTAAAEAETRRVAEHAKHAVDAAQAELRGQREENARLGNAVARGEAEAALLKSELQTAHERVEAAERDLMLTVDAHTELDTALQNAEAESRHAAQARTSLESELGAARHTLERAIADADNLRREADHLRQEAGHLRHELERQQQDRQAIEAQLRDAHENDRHQAEALAGERHATGARLQALEAELFGARAALEKHDAVAAELEVSQARVRSLETERAQQDQQTRELQGRLDDALGAEAKLREAVARAADRSDGSADAEQAEALRWELERMVSLFDASVRAVNEMAKARSSSELLSELVKRMSIQFSRVALFRVKGHALEGEQQIGFDDTDITKLVLPNAMDSLLSRAMASGLVESVNGTNLASALGTPFGGSPTSAVALPIAVHGTTLAVVYADDADMPESARGPAVHESSVGFAKLLMGEASVVLTCHTHELKMLAELRQYANTLLQEAKQMYLADAEAGKPAAQLRGRLKDNLECASQLYTYRAAMEGTAAAALLDEMISAEMAGSGAFARDLAFVVGEMSGADLAVTAEAS
jgi:hypothetical protein